MNPWLWALCICVLAGLSLYGLDQRRALGFDLSQLAHAVVPLQAVRACPELARFGGQSAEDGFAVDGGKLLCGLSSLPHNCVIYSLGSYNDFSFEEAMLSATPCAIHTFDCTVDGSTKPADSRIVFHRQCLGDSGAPGFFSLPQLAAQNGHTRIDLLKMDIEGGEYGVFASLLAAASDGNSDLLPAQISFELHAAAGAAVGKAASASLWSTVWALGYAIVSRENNIYCPTCVEFTLLRGGVFLRGGAHGAHVPLTS